MKDGTECVFRAHMSLTAAYLEIKSDIALYIIVNTYTQEGAAVHISSEIWNHIRARVIHGQRMLV